MNPFTRPKRSLMPERVQVPGVDQEKVEALQEALDWHVRQRRGFLVAMLSKGKPFARHSTPARKRKRKTAHVRRMEAHAARAYFLQGKA